MGPRGHYGPPLPGALRNRYDSQLKISAEEVVAR
jgi:hypothetical protein